MSTNKTEKILFINCFCSILIVMHHAFTRIIDYDCMPINLGEQVVWGVERFFYNFSECAVPVFFFLSAFLFYKNYDNTLYFSKIKKRFYSLVIPYIIFNTLGYIKHFITSHGETEVEFLEAIVCSSTMPLWFIRELVIFSLLAPIIYYIIKNKKVMIVVVIGFFILAVTGVTQYNYCLYWMPIYLIGAYCGCHYKTLDLNAFHKCSTPLVVLFTIMFIVFSNFLPNTSGQNNVFISRLIFYLFRIISPLMFLLNYRFLCKIKEREFMKYSFFTYCIHFPMIRIYQMIWNRISVSNVYMELMEYFTSILFTIVVCTLVGIFLKKYCINVWRILNGGR